MGISRFGSRVEERIARGKAAEEAEAERLANRTPLEVAADAVSEAAEDYRMIEATGASLERAFLTALIEVERKASVKTTSSPAVNATGNEIVSSILRSPSTGWTRSTTASTEYDIQRMGYVITLRPPIRTTEYPYPGTPGPKVYFFAEEALNRHATTARDFEAWILGVAHAAMTIVECSYYGVHSAANEALMRRPESLENAYLSLHHLGVIVDGHDKYERASEEAAAIESIRRTLGEVSEQ